MKHWTIEYILHVLEAKDWSMNRLASEAGVSPSTINRPIREKDWSFAISARTIGKIFRATNIDPSPFMPKGMSEPASMYMGEESKPRPKSSAQTTLENLDSETSAPAFAVNEIKIAMVGPIAQIIATVDREGIAKLRKKLDAIEAMLDD